MGRASTELLEDAVRLFPLGPPGENEVWVMSQGCTSSMYNKFVRKLLGRKVETTDN